MTLHGFWDLVLVGTVLAASLGYACRIFVPRPLRRRVVLGMVAMLRRASSRGAVLRFAARLEDAANRPVAGGCGSCGDCASSAPSRAEVTIPLAELRRRRMPS